MAATRDGIDALLRDRGLRRTTPDLTAESLLRGAHASAVLEGSSSTLEEVRDGRRRRGGAGGRSGSAPSCSGWRPTLARSPLQALARLHTLAGKGDAADDDLGRPRDADAAARLRDLGALLAAAPRRRPWWSPRVVHAELADRRAVRLAQRDRRPRRRAAGAGQPRRGRQVAGRPGGRAPGPAARSTSRTCAGYRDGGAAGVHAWLLYAAEAYAAGRRGEPAAAASDRAAETPAHAAAPGSQDLRCRR